MKTLLTPSRTMAAVLLLWGWGCAQGQSLGTPVADALLGQRLDMTVPARFGSEDNGNECVQADVFYGETRVNPNRVRAVVTGPADQRRIRIESDLPIDEPVVTVSVRAGCRNTITRNYTLLPEYPSERLLAAADARAAMVAAAVAAPLQLARSNTPSIGATSPRRATAPRTVVARAEREATPSQRPRSARAFRKEAVASGPRLRLEPIELAEPPNTLLRVSSTLAEPNGDASRRAAAAMLWQAINADPQEVLRTSVMLQKLERDLVQLRKSDGQTRAEMAALRKRLDEAQPWYASPVLVQVLALLVLAAASAAGLLWYRTRGLRTRSELWYMPADAANEAAVLPEDQEPVAEVPVPVVTPAAVPEPAVVAVPRREPLRAVVAEAPQAAQPPAVSQEGPIDFELPAAAQPAPGSALRVETLAATFEEVEFLRSLGLTTDAMDILKAYLQDSTGPAPLAYLALMQLCEQAQDPAAVATVRRRYAQAFGVEAPRLVQICADTGLDGQPELSGRITRAWGTAEALPTIERALFAVPTPAAPLTLQTGRDLLALHDLALARASEGGAEGGELADAHPLAPWANGEDGHPRQDLADMLAEPDGGLHFALDVDLDTPAAVEPESGSGPQLAPELELVPKLAQIQADAAREAAQRAAQEEEDAFSAAVASERIPVSRY